jgi:hypothetical protein
MLHYLFASLQRGESAAPGLSVSGGASLTGTAQWSEHNLPFTFKRDLLKRVYQTPDVHAPYRRHYTSILASRFSTLVPI